MVDHFVGQLMDGLMDMGMDKCTNIIVLSDHGKRMHLFSIFHLIWKDYKLVKGLIQSSLLAPPPNRLPSLWLFTVLGCLQKIQRYMWISTEPW